MQHSMKLKQPYFDLIKTKIKTYEIRLFDEKRQKIQVGDEIVFEKDPNDGEVLHTFVVDLLRFPNFSTMLETLDFNKIGFGGKTKEEIEKTYHEFYTKEEEQMFGVLAIKVQVI